MKERPILFSGPMVRALLDGTKTQTRRAVRKQFVADALVAEVPATTPEGWQVSGHSGLWWDDAGACLDDAVRCPYGMPGDRLWVREAWAQNWNQLSDTRMDRSHVYRADGGPRAQDNGTDLPWRPSIHMPRWASRITLEVIGVRVERLQDISEADAAAEGWTKRPDVSADPSVHADAARDWYADLWDQINGVGSWAANPWVWCVEFKPAALTGKAGKE